MPAPLDRREFLKHAGSAAAAAWMATGAAQPVIGSEGASEPRFKLAVKIGMVQGDLSLHEKFQLLKAIGYDGIELNSPNGFTTDEVLAARDETGLPIHGVVDSVHWKQTLSDPNPDVRAEGVEALKTALRDAKAYGATSVLLVPAVVNQDVSYADAYKRSQAEIKKALPLAEELGIRILLENVWNNFLLSPLETARYVDELDSPMMGVYFDVGNVVRYGWPEHWIQTLGRRIAKLDIKEYSRDKQMKEGLYKGFQVEIGEGDCDWPAVRTALDEIGYSGWATAEVRGGGEERLRDIHERMDRALRS
ncbi:MAG: sugar phosphate isomerase/epimerase family protein [Planctomycetaceae bacterium]